MSVHWAEMGESTFVLGTRLLVAVYRLFGRVPFRLVLYPVVFYYRLTGKVPRQSSMDYLARLQASHGSLGQAPTWRHGLRHFLSFADTLLDKILATSGRYRFDDVRLVGAEPVIAMLERGEGGVFVTGHVGCLEVCQGAIDHTQRMRLNVLVHTAHAEQFNRVLGRLHPDSLVTLIQVTEITPATAVMLAEKVERGEWVAIAGDRVPVGAGRTTTAPFLGETAHWPVGPYVLASLLRCPLYLMACVREGRGHAMHFHRLADRVELPRQRRDEVFAQLAAQFARQLELLLARSPYEWFNFFPFWAQR